ncbi:hypothetical protein G9A89_011682 [Geosiphon pyriformis]|nr:hypothetical protein G9A89_011682 [Geosiphon pyriformis]
MSEIMAYCSAMWSDVRKLEHIAQEIIAHYLEMKLRITSTKNLCSLYKGFNSKNFQIQPTYQYYQHCQDIEHQRTSTINNHPKVAESEIIGTNHLGFAKSLFQQYTESAFNFYVNNKITDCLGGTVNIESARENFYTELFQHISLPRNYSFAPIIREINQTIKKYTQQQFPITYVDKSKERLQTPAVTPKQIQPLNWKKT